MSESQSPPAKRAKLHLDSSFESDSSIVGSVQNDLEVTLDDKLSPEALEQLKKDIENELHHALLKTSSPELSELSSDNADNNNAHDSVNIPIFHVQ